VFAEHISLRLSFEVVSYMRVFCVAGTKDRRGKG
jgi:hypothetical protein